MEQIKYFYESINKSMFSGAIDVIVIEQPDGTLKSTTWHIAFSAAAVVSSRKEVEFRINGEVVQIRMLVESNGIAKFVKEELPEQQLSTSSAIPEVKLITTQRLESDQLIGLNLRHGRNEATFSVTTTFQGTTKITCGVYLFKWSDNFVVSDIDGTITRSDLKGHVYYAVGVKWEHNGIAELYSRIKSNGYQILYLSSRPIGQSISTKNYLNKIIQGNSTLPDGPTLVSPSSVVEAVKRELSGNPDAFKIPCLSDVKELFPTKQPFYAGFGNRETDVRSYKAVGIPLSRIYIVDSYGTVTRADSIGFMTRYDLLATEFLDQIFPPLKRKRVPSKVNLEEMMTPEFTKAEKFSQYTYWRTSPDEVDSIDDNDLASYEFHRSKLKSKNIKRRALSF